MLDKTYARRQPLDVVEEVAHTPEQKEWIASRVGVQDVVTRPKGQVVIRGYGWFAARMENRLDNSVWALPELRGVAARSSDIGRIDLREIDQMRMSRRTMTERPA